MAPGTRRNGKIDEEIEESFPASDPPAFTAGGERLGAPRRRRKAKKAAPGRKKAAPNRKKPPAKKRKATRRRKPRS